MGRAAPAARRGRPGRAGEPGARERVHGRAGRAARAGRREQVRTGVRVRHQADDGGVHEPERRAPGRRRCYGDVTRVGPFAGTRARQAPTSWRWWTTSCTKYCPSVRSVKTDRSSAARDAPTGRGRGRRSGPRRARPRSGARARRRPGPGARSPPRPPSRPGPSWRTAGRPLDHGLHAHVEHGEDVADVRGVLEHGPGRRVRAGPRVRAGQGRDVARDGVADRGAHAVGRDLGGDEPALGARVLHDPCPVLGVRGDGREPGSGAAAGTPSGDAVVSMAAVCQTAQHPPGARIVGD